MRFTPPDGVLNLAQTLDCGQSFRFYPVTLENNIPAWRGVAFSRGLTVYQDENNDLVLDCTAQEFRDIWFDYFDFNTDYKKSREVLSALHPALKEAAEFAGGIRILKQEPFEALCSFIISQNNNIPRIKGIIERLCLHFGEPFLYHNETRYAFPTPKNWPPARRKTSLRCARASREISHRCRKAHRFRRDRFRSRAQNASSRCQSEIADDFRRRPKSRGLRFALRSAPHGMLPDGRVDEARRIAFAEAFPRRFR